MEKISEEQLMERREALADHYGSILGLLGENVEREGLCVLQKRCNT